MSDHVEWFSATSPVDVLVKPDSIFSADGPGNAKPVVVLGEWGNLAVFEGTFKELHAFAQRIKDAITMAESHPDLHGNEEDNGGS